MFKNYKLMDWMMFLLLILQMTSQVLNFMVNSDYSVSPFINIWISLGETISQNWLPFSVTLIFITTGNFLYNKILNNTYNWKQNLSSVILLILNLMLCNKIYSVSSWNEKNKFFIDNFPTTIFVILIIILIIISFVVINIRKKLKKEIDKNNLKVEPSNQPNQESEDKKDFALKHPFLYSWYLKQYYSNKHKEISHELKSANIKNRAKYKEKKDEYKLKLLNSKFEAQEKIQELKNNKSIESIQNDENKVKNWWHQLRDPQNIFGILATTISIVVLVIIVFSMTKNTISGENGFIALYNQIIANFGNFGKSLSSSDSSLKNLLLSLGTLFLLAIAFFTMYLLIYIALRIAFYIFINFNEDNNQIAKYVKLIKSFVYGIINGVLRILLFIPNFLKFVEEYILETNLDDIISEYDKTKNENKESENKGNGEDE